MRHYQQRDSQYPLNPLLGFEDWTSELRPDTITLLLIKHNYIDDVTDGQRLTDIRRAAGEGGDIKLAKASRD